VPAHNATLINWEAMDKAMRLFDAQSQIAHGAERRLVGLQEEAALAWQGSAGKAWNDAVGDWLRGFNTVLADLDSITSTLHTEIQNHLATEEKNRQTAGGR
jgi:uncharacterized protein YukE